MSGITESVVEEACLELVPLARIYDGVRPGHRPRRPVRGAVVVGGRDPRWPVAQCRCDDQPGPLPRASVDQVIATVLRAESQNPLGGEPPPAPPHDRRRPGRAPRRGRFDPPRARVAHRLRATRTATTGWPSNQFTVVEQGKNRRPDVVVFCNGLPVGLLELKNPGDEHATLKGAWNQIQTYRKRHPGDLHAERRDAWSPTGSARRWARSRRASSTTRRGRRSTAASS